MKPEQLLQALIDGQVSPAEFCQAAHKMNGLSFWAMDIEGRPGWYTVEIRQGGRLVEEKQMSREELEAFKTMCASWIVTEEESPEFVHAGNRRSAFVPFQK